MKIRRGNHRWAKISLSVLAGVILTLVVTITVSGFLFPADKMAGGTHYDLKQAPSDVVSYLQSKYSGKSNLNISLSSQKKLNQPNLEQEGLNYQYNNDYGRQNGYQMVNGTCSEVATAMLMFTYGYANNLTADQAFAGAMNIAIAKLYYKFPNPDKGATPVSKLDNLVTDCVSGHNQKGNNDRTSIYDTIVDYVNDGKSTILSMPEHSMQAVGYAVYTVKYKKKVLWWTSDETVTEKFVVVNDGWFDAADDSQYRQYSYYPESLISNTILGMSYLTKIIDN